MAAGSGRRSSRGRAIAAALCAALAACACAGAGAPAPPSFVLVVVDTLRADQLGFAGGRGAATPHFDALQQRSVWFRNAYSTSSWTLPAVASLLVSQLPSQHRVVYWGSKLPPEQVTVVEALHQAGYRTAGWSANVLVDESSGVEQGFERYETLIDLEGWGKINLEMFPNAPGEQVTERALSWLRELRAADPASPFFLYLHYMDPHTPYRCETSPRCRDGAAYLSERILEHRWDFRPQELELIRSLYRQEVQRVDAALGALLAGLEAQGVAGDTWVVVTADHGELLGEAGRFLHGASLEPVEVRVPLLFAGPGARGSLEVEAPVSLMDLAPTLLDLAGVAAPAGFRGRSLRPALSGEALAPLPAVAELVGRAGEGPEAEPRHRLLAVRGHEKIVMAADGGLRRVDLRAPPRARRSHPASRAQLDALLGERAEWIDWALDGSQPPPALTPELRERLRALGYGGG